MEEEFQEAEQLIELPIEGDVVMRSFCPIRGADDGAVSVDEPGLHIAHPEPSDEELASYTYNGYTVEIVDDAILPLMGSACQFPTMCGSVNGLLDVIWGEEEDSQCQLFGRVSWQVAGEIPGQGFFKDHCKRYKKKPIYWLFASKKGAFQVLVYRAHECVHGAEDS